MQQPIHQAITVTVDVVLLTLKQDVLHVVLLKRDKEPYLGQLALPGGFIHSEEDADSLAAARRILRDKTGILTPYLEQLYTFSSGARDPRGWSISITYYALVGEAVLAQANEALAELQVLPVAGLPQLSFDHNVLIAKAVQRVQDKTSYSSLPCYLLPEHFTLSELMHTYECVLGSKLDKSSFRRKLADLDFLELMKGRIRTGTHRPAQLYRIRPDKRLVLFDRTV